MCRDGNFDAIIGNGYGDAWIDMNQYFASGAVHGSAVADGGDHEQSHGAVEELRAEQDPPASAEEALRPVPVPERAHNENQTPLYRSPPFHKFNGIPGQNNKVPCGIHKL